MPVALVTGGSRGVGRGISIALGEHGYTVYATGRTIADADLPERIVRVTCDHLDDAQTAAVFRRISDETGALDLLVNSAWGGYERMVENGAFTWSAPFWEQPTHRWTSMMDAGVRAAFITSACAARIMASRRAGLIVNISFWAAQKYIGNAIYGAAKAAIDKLSTDTAHELRPYRVAVFSLYPGLVRTESVMQAAAAGWLDISNSESPQFIGHVIAGIASSASILERSGAVLVAAEIARELGITDIDGRQPVPLTIDAV